MALDSDTFPLPLSFQLLVFQNYLLAIWCHNSIHVSEQTYRTVTEPSKHMWWSSYSKWMSFCGETLMAQWYHEATNWSSKQRSWGGGKQHLWLSGIIWQWTDHPNNKPWGGEGGCNTNGSVVSCSNKLIIHTMIPQMNACDGQK